MCAEPCHYGFTSGPSIKYAPTLTLKILTLSQLKGNGFDGVVPQPNMVTTNIAIVLSIRCMAEIRAPWLYVVSFR